MTFHVADFTTKYTDNNPNKLLNNIRKLKNVRHVEEIQQMISGSTPVIRKQPGIIVGDAVLSSKQDIQLLKQDLESLGLNEITITVSVEQKSKSNQIISKIKGLRDRIYFNPKKMKLGKVYEFEIDGEQFAFVRTKNEPNKVTFFTKEDGI